MFKVAFCNQVKYVPKPLQNLRWQSSALNIKELESSSNTEVIDEDIKAKEALIDQKRNKSGLSRQHRNMVHNKVPFKEPQHWSHGTLKYQRKIYATYGNESQFNQSLCWTREEIKDKKEYEAVAYPYTIPQLIEKAQEEKRRKEEAISKRQEEVAQKLAKNEQFKDELHKKMAKKEAEAKAAKDRKDKLIEEVRRHFGYTVDPRDDRFKEMLEKKEKEQRKASREARKKAKEEEMLQKMLEKDKVKE